MSSPNYTPTTWVNDGPPALNADNLNHAEQGIVAVDNAAQSGIAGITLAGLGGTTAAAAAAAAATASKSADTIVDGTTNRVLTAAAATVLGNTSGTNTGDQSGGTPAVVLGTAAAAGVSTHFLRDDDTIVAFDATAPSTQAFGDTAAAGSAAVAPRRDHKHGMPVSPKDTTAQTGLLKGNGTAITAATAGMDYYAPGSTDVAIADGGTGVSSLPTGLLKGAGTGSITAAAQGTDYYAPGGTDVAVADGGTGSSTAANARVALGIAASRIAALGSMGATPSLALTSADTQLVVATGTLTANAVLAITGMLAGQTVRLIITQDATGGRILNVTVNGGSSYTIGVVPLIAGNTLVDIFYDGTNVWPFPGVTSDISGNQHAVRAQGQRLSFWNAPEYYTQVTAGMYFDGDGITMNREFSLHFAGQTQNLYAQGVTMGNNCLVSWAAGDVLAIATTALEWTKIAVANSPLVAGVAPNITKGGFPSSGGAGSVAYAMLLGQCQVTCDTGAVAIGDLLVSSATTGQAMTNNAATAGTIIGKALQSKAGGASGKIYALITCGA